MYGCEWRRVECLRTVLHVLWLKLLNLLLSHPSSDLCTGSRLVNASNINSCRSPTKFLQPANLTTYTILSLFRLQVELAPHLLSPCSTICIFLITNHQSLFHICITFSDLTCGISSLLHAVDLILFTLLLGWSTSTCAYFKYLSLDLSLQT